jgi:hypothetical protein
LETVIMNPRLVATISLCRDVALPVSVLVWLVAFGSGAAPIVDRFAPVLMADAKTAEVKTADARIAGTMVAGTLQPMAFATADVATASRSITETPAAKTSATETPATDAPAADATTPASPEPAPIVTAALTDSSETPRPEASPEPATNLSMATPEPNEANRAVGSTEVTDECFAADSCIDRYLWALYQRTSKEDSVKIQEQRQVTVRKKGRLVTVTKTFTTLADEDFAWKDPKAAEHAGMPMPDYVIGGMDRDFKLKLVHLLHAAEQAGLSPGITSAFRDDYRQSIASGLKAANDRSYHGGSSRGGYGHGLAADIVSVNGATRAQRLISSQTLWSWVDAHGKEFGIGRPYLDRDPPHMAPIDGKEYAAHHPGMKARQAGSAAKPRNKLASRTDHSEAKRTRTARSSKMGTT